ncbi:uncharacterized protein TNIN_100331 [Trichonephila inaurata madagascariensis]|uniref:Uncharacterized protein n=1 Tax=Trichonephila inaurata madagascariensis TaxID=2747483 RepID=A0A8X6YEH2_9ARAC|nr:uncharacterized protein TNIN_100331 [Trichonephila inaurata madagascariensis]
MWLETVFEDSGGIVKILLINDFRDLFLTVLRRFERFVRSHVDPRHQSEPGFRVRPPGQGARTVRRCTCRTPMSNMRPSQSHRRTDSDGCSCQSTGSEESCSLTDDYPSDTTTSSTRSSIPGPGGRGAPHTVLSGWNFYSSHHQSRTPHKNGHRHHSQERLCKANNPNHRRCSSGSSNHSKRMDSGYNGGTGSIHDGAARSPVETLSGSQEPFFLHEPNMTSDDRVKKLFDNKSKKTSTDEEETSENNVNNNINNNTNGSQIVTVEVHNSSASEDSNSVSDVSDPIPDYDDQGSQSSSTGNNNNNTINGRHRSKKTSREVSSLSTDEGIYHGEDEDEDELDDDEMHRLVPHHPAEDEEDDEDELHDNEVSFSPHHQEDLVAIRNKRPPPETESPYGGGNHVHVSRRASNPVDATHEDSKKLENNVKENGTLMVEKPKNNFNNNNSNTNNNSHGTLTRQQTPSQVIKKTVEPVTSQPPPPPPLPTKKPEEQQKPVVKPPTPPPLPKSTQAKIDEEASRVKAPPPPPPPDLPPSKEHRHSKISHSDDSRSHHEDDRASQRSDESSVDGSEGKRYVKSTAARRNSHQRTLPFIPPQFNFPPDTNDNIRPSEYLRQTKTSGGSKHSTLKSNSTLHRAVSMGELAMASKPEKISYGSRTESHETLLDSDSRSHFVQSPINGKEEPKPHAPLTNTNSNGNNPLFNVTVEQLQTVQLKKTDKPSTPERTVLLQKNDLIAELKQTKDIQGVRKMKEERSKIEEVFTADMAQNFKAEKFVDQIPEVDANGCVIPPWKRQMLAKKAAEKAKKEAEEQLIREAEAKKLNSIPPWKRQLMQRKEPCSPVTIQNIHRTMSTPVVKSPNLQLSKHHQNLPRASSKRNQPQLNRLPDPQNRKPKMVTPTTFLPTPGSSNSERQKVSFDDNNAPVIILCET